MKTLLLSILVLGISTNILSQKTVNNIEDKLTGGSSLVFKAKLFIKETEEKSLLLFCNTNYETLDNFNIAIAIFSASQIQKPSVSENDIYEIVIANSKKFATVTNTNTNKFFIIGISDQQTEIDKLKSDISLEKNVIENDYIGYGFSLMKACWLKNKVLNTKLKFAFNILTYSNIDDAISRKAPAVGAEGDEYIFCKQGTCSSGGAGSSSCSITEVSPIGDPQCSVTCNAGYYSCCDSNVTRCYCCKESN